ncbi:hypothetical protein MAR_037558 [Mya arenaria]|uniref:Histidine-specific methyltransferase SAM-dependent domain-containing protein n=1 Tax=Mya arenaria TaxID=6604 RepID=A0ABY7FRW7_MYAAR|nr:hypothetical protein MAR_037558 [Mya arenaria]
MTEVGIHKAKISTKLGADRLLVALDVTQEAEAVEKAYLDPADNFRLEANFDHSTEDDTLSGVKLRAVSCNDQEIHIRKIVVLGEYLSCKYTDAQVGSLAEKAGLTLNRIWTDPGLHVGLFCFAKDV